MNNLKQIGLGFQMYSQDYKGFLMLSTGDAVNGGTKEWFRHSAYIGKYIPSQKLVVCPAYPPYEYDDDYPLSAYGWRHGYSTGLWRVIFPSTYIKDKTISGYDTSLVEWPSKLFVIADSIYIGTDEKYKGRQYRYSHAGESISVKPNNTGVLHLRHSGHANMLFVDGHVEAVSKSKLVENETAYRGTSTYKFWWMVDEKGNLGDEPIIW
ncbi:hypothetical protein M0P98_06430 [bacterium]|nr:hypothetical protein [bacterium]